MDRAKMMAEWEPQQCANTNINGGLDAAVRALHVSRASTPNCARLDSRLRWQLTTEKYCRRLESRRGAGCSDSETAFR